VCSKVFSRVCSKVCLILGVRFRHPTLPRFGRHDNDADDNDDASVVQSRPGCQAPPISYYDNVPIDFRTSHTFLLMVLFGLHRSSRAVPKQKRAGPTKSYRRSSPGTFSDGTTNRGGDRDSFHRQSDQQVRWWSEMPESAGEVTCSLSPNAHLCRMRPPYPIGRCPRAPHYRKMIAVVTKERKL
jgi:hypothetical protein